MPISQPLYEEGDVVYLRESAALGFLEAVRIGGITHSSQGWLYVVESRVPQPRAAAHIGDRITAVHGKPLYFSESEFVTHCDALDLVEANLSTQLNRIQAQKASLCADPTAGNT